METSHVGVRWTIGAVSDRGWEALRLSVWGMYRLLGPAAGYAISVNCVSVDEAQHRVGSLPDDVIWYSAGEVPAFIREHLDDGMAEGVGWKFSPLRFFPDRYELSLDNDCILWELPEAIHRWIEEADGETCVFAEDVARCLGQFSDLCGPESRNAGIRGIPPGFDLERNFRALLAEKKRRDGKPLVMSSEQDEQGLQAAMVERFGKPRIVRVDEVSICSPFPPHLPHLGRCGAHFVGTNARQLSWDYEGRNGIEYVHDHWLRHRTALYERVGLSGPAEP